MFIHKSFKIVFVLRPSIFSWRSFRIWFFFVFIMLYSSLFIFVIILFHQCLGSLFDTCFIKLRISSEIYSGSLADLRIKVFGEFLAFHFPSVDGLVRVCLANHFYLLVFLDIIFNVVIDNSVISDMELRHALRQTLR